MTFRPFDPGSHYLTVLFHGCCSILLRCSMLKRSNDNNRMCSCGHPTTCFAGVGTSGSSLACWVIVVNNEFISSKRKSCPAFWTVRRRKEGLPLPLSLPKNRAYNSYARINGFSPEPPPHTLNTIQIPHRLAHSPAVRLPVPVRPHCFHTSPTTSVSTSAPRGLDHLPIPACSGAERSSTLMCCSISTSAHPR